MATSLEDLVSTLARVLCASPEYVEKHGAPRSPNDLRGHRCLRFSLVRAEVDWRFREGRADAVLPTSGPLATDNTEALRRAALAGLGIVALPRFYLAGDLARGNLVELLPDSPLAPLGLFVVHAKGRVVAAKIRRFIEHLARRLRAEELD